MQGALGAVAIGDLSVAAGVSTTHLAQRFKELIGVTPKRLTSRPRTGRLAAADRLISYKSDSPRNSNLRASPQAEERRWAK